MSHEAFAIPAAHLRAQGPARRPRTRVSLVTSDSFADRLNRLFNTVYPPGRGPFRGIEVVDALAARGHTLSAAYLSQLRRGQRTQPSRETIDLIAEFFGIRAAYFTGEDPAYSRRLEAELEWLNLARNPNVRTLTTALVDLSPAARESALAAVGGNAR